MHIKPITTCLLVLFLQGCSHTTVTSSTKYSDPPKIKNLLIRDMYFGAFANNDSKKTEDLLGKYFSICGISATSPHRIDDLKATVDSTGADAILTLHRTKQTVDMSTGRTVELDGFANLSDATGKRVYWVAGIEFDGATFGEKEKLVSSAIISAMREHGILHECNQ